MAGLLVAAVSVSMRTDAVTAAARKRAADATRVAAFNIEAGAKRRARVDTGAMRNAIKAEQQDELAWTVTGYAEHTIYNEFGTTRMTAQPMFVPAVEEERPRLLAALRELA